MLSVAVAQSSSGSVAVGLSYVLSVLQITSDFQLWALYGAGNVHVTQYVCLFVRPSVRPSQSGIVSKRLVG